MMSSTAITFLIYVLMTLASLAPSATAQTCNDWSTQSTVSVYFTQNTDTGVIGKRVFSGSTEVADGRTPITLGSFTATCPMQVRVVSNGYNLSYGGSTSNYYIDLSSLAITTLTAGTYSI